MPPVDLVPGWDWIGCIDSGFNGPGYSHYGEKYYEPYDSGFQIYRVIPADVLEGEDIEDPAAREEMRSWARHEFKRNKNVEEMTQIRYLISQGRHEMETIILYLKYATRQLGNLVPRSGTYRIVLSRMYTSEIAEGLEGTYMRIELAPLELPYRCQCKKSYPGHR
ncbi:hypothetical protein AOL_s00004g251 [Orbilia oligospora ATCC 24927]|uniref:Complex 1 LYR protein domain-containing protein n=1 Tax=Arthrobotrys oligospora (strain ATCC 24927 / CBS 115.81 / DSM 1491) TaxID=756982 RepID=G1WY91_ARTOA|nr:hypothetical protein AOL_s00004g251 [Orbilia oligospora ATCC 24927]EGX54218.1 hypothetical protein AOL_s00004g251 [Orbilia oligospora ATCC 24927]